MKFQFILEIERKNWKKLVRISHTDLKEHDPENCKIGGQAIMPYRAIEGFPYQ